MRKLKYIRHPYLILRTLTGILERKFNNVARLYEHQRYTYDAEEGLIRLLACDLGTVRSLRLELENKAEFCNTISRHWEALKGFGGGMGIDDCSFLYVICRVIRPKIVVETGTGNGFSSSYILQALEDNGCGELHSIDLHYRDGVSVPIGKELGWVIPERLRHRFHLMLGESFKLLSPLLRDVGFIDIFLHDSRHTYRTMMKEYETAWPHLQEAGLLLSHDVEDSDAFLDFCDKMRSSPIIVGNVGALKKANW